MQVISDYYSNGCLLKETARRFDLHPTTVRLWLKNYCTVQKNDVPLSQTDNNAAMDEQTQSITIGSLQERIRNLEASLHYERMRVKAYERLIEVAKKEEGVDVLKKAGAEQ